ncbi:MAG: exodeoxyribonuclease V subunit alpha [bacterium]|nr:exodeoxyribonuclease V subunit alpha [bacterium]
MKWDLKSLSEGGLLCALDRQLAQRLIPEGGPVQTALALLSYALTQGHVGLDLSQLLRSQWPLAEGVLELSPPSAQELEAALNSHPLVGAPLEYKPLIWDGKRLYFQKYFDYQQRLIANIQDRLAQPSAPLTAELLKAHREAFAGLAALNQGQPLAALLAAVMPFFILTGGPGTGKTTTAFKMLLLLQQSRLDQGQAPLKIQLVAPTGKAAARLGESMNAQKVGLQRELAESLPDQAQTLHRFLGYQPFSPQDFLHHQGFLAEVDLLLLDEASMVDLPLFVKLLEALPVECKVILMGDPDQLASVESGAVLGDLAQDKDPRGLRQSFAEQLAELAPEGPFEAAGPALLDHRLRLKQSHRFDPNRGIGRLAEAVRLDHSPLLPLLQSEQTEHLEVKDPAAFKTQVERLLKAGLKPMHQSLDPTQALAAQRKFQLLTALRLGPYGVEGVNLIGEGLWGHNQSFYPHRPILITQNAPHLGLSNGDLGLCLPDAQAVLKVWFEGPEGPRAVPLALLPAHQSAYALTVHKSQGSEFDQVVLALPEVFCEPLCRELVYTALTRAKTRFCLLGSAEVFEEAVRQSATRHSGLGAAFWGEPAAP